MLQFKQAVRHLARTPFVTTVAVASLALGIGANAAIFSLFNQVLLRPLPVAAPERLVNLSAPGPNPGSQSCNQSGDCTVIFSYPMLRDLEREQKVFTGIAGHRAFGANLALGGHTPTSGEGSLVSGSYFSVLGLTPALGRLLSPADDQAVGASSVAVLAHAYWESRLGSDPAAVGKTIVVNGHPFTIVGVAPRGFRGTTLGSEPSVFVPLSMRAQVSPGFDGFENRRSYWIYAFARLRDGVTLEAAATAMNAVFTPILATIEAPLQEGMSEATMARFKAKQLVLEPGSRGQSSVHGESRVPLLLLLSLTGLVLVIACANIANLLLARGTSRAAEMAVRLSLGATRGQLLGQLLLESCLLALLGGAASLLVAQWTLAGIAALLPAGQSEIFTFALERPVVIFTGLLALGTGLLFGMFPALHSTQPDLITTIRSSAGQLAGVRTAARFRGALVTGQIALSMALLIAAGLFVKSLANVSRVDLGLDAERVVTFGLSPELNGYPADRSRLLFQRVEEELGAIPGVSGVAASMVPLLAGSNWGSDVGVEGFPTGPDVDNNSRFNRVGPGYFRVLGVPLLAGREFTAADALGRPKVAIVNETFAKKFNLGRDAVGKRISSGGGNELDTEIIGLARDSKYSEVKQVIPPVFVLPYLQDSTVGAMSFYVRTALPPEDLLRSIPGVIARLDPNLPVEELRTLPQQVRDNVFLDRVITTLSAAFAVLATLLAAVGLYGVLAYTVAQRTREIGVRMALGADAAQVRGMVLRQVARMIVVGGIIGVAAAIGLGKAAGSLLYGLSGTDPVIIAAAVALSVLVAFGAGYLPARRASRVHPMQALRYE